MTLKDHIFDHGARLHWSWNQAQVGHWGGVGNIPLGISILFNKVILFSKNFFSFGAFVVRT